jgi:hypothetical protein
VVNLLERKIPKKAVKPLIEHCNKLGEKTGRSGAEVFQKYLELMKKYEDFFFGGRWPAKPVPKGELWLSDEEDEFVSGGGDYEEETERFTVAVLRRNISMEGFDAESFDFEFDLYGRLACLGCQVPEAMHLRVYTQKLIELYEDIERKIASGNPSRFWVDLWEYRKKPETIKGDMMPFVHLKFLEEHGGTEGRVCRVFKHNKYLCPYGGESNELIKLGELVDYLWKLVQFYDWHWNRSSSLVPAAGDEKWYHWNEPGFLEVTSYNDVFNALEDGRMNRIADEYVEYEKEVRANQPVRATDSYEET